MGECDKFVNVDFGEGTVSVPCKRLGRHRLHWITFEWVEPDESLVEHKNIFED